MIYLKNNIVDYLHLYVMELVSTVKSTIMLQQHLTIKEFLFSHMIMVSRNLVSFTIVRLIFSKNLLNAFEQFEMKL